MSSGPPYMLCHFIYCPYSRHLSSPPIHKRIKQPETPSISLHSLSLSPPWAQRESNVQLDMRNSASSFTCISSSESICLEADEEEEEEEEDEDVIHLSLGPPGQSYPKRRQYPMHNNSRSLKAPMQFHEMIHQDSFCGAANDDNMVTVSLHIGPPVSFRGAGEGSSIIGSQHDSGGLNVGHGQYWIPSPAQILVGPTQFSCPVCAKTFNRYNNMQVTLSKHHLSNICQFMYRKLRAVCILFLDNVEFAIICFLFLLILFFYIEKNH